MPTFTSDQGRVYDVDGRYFIWHPEVWDGEPALPDVRIPLRMKLGRLLDIAEDGNIRGRGNERAVILSIIPQVEPVLADMDVLDFQDMFQTWLSTYNQLSGASLGEASGSPASSKSTAGRPSTTSARASRSRSKK